MEQANIDQDYIAHCTKCPHIAEGATQIEAFERLGQHMKNAHQGQGAESKRPKSKRARLALVSNR